jgi:hypothetical protein
LDISLDLSHVNISLALRLTLSIAHKEKNLTNKRKILISAKVRKAWLLPLSKPSPKSTSTIAAFCNRTFSTKANHTNHLRFAKHLSSVALQEYAEATRPARILMSILGEKNSSGRTPLP